jgi:hypothetical protein
MNFAGKNNDVRVELQVKWGLYWTDKVKSIYSRVKYTRSEDKTLSILNLGSR